jgi:ribosome-associated protein
VECAGAGRRRRTDEGKDARLAERTRGSSATDVAVESREMARLAARAASSKQGANIVILDVRELITITDYFVIVSGSSERQVSTLAEEVERSLKAEGVRPVRREGESGTRWLLLDYVDFVVHVFHEEEREYYRLETLWRDAPVVEWEETAEVSSG